MLWHGSGFPGFVVPVFVGPGFDNPGFDGPAFVGPGFDREPLAPPQHLFKVSEFDHVEISESGF